MEENASAAKISQVAGGLRSSPAKSWRPVQNYNPDLIFLGGTGELETRLIDLQSLDFRL